MKILYGIQLNGNGHITRSLELINQLKAKGYEVDVIASGGNYSIELPDYIKKFKGLSMYFNKSGRINKLKTTLSLNLFKLIKDVNYDCSVYDLVISDFEPISAYSAKKHKVKSIGISNQVSIIKSNFLESLSTLLTELQDVNNIIIVININPILTFLFIWFVFI